MHCHAVNPRGISAKNLKKEGLMRIIAIANQKGGCGKTTTAINLSSCLALKGQRVLLIDFDPQAHATMGLNIDFDTEKSMYHVMAPEQNGQPGLEDIVIPVKEGLDIAPSDVRLSAIEQELAGVEARENKLMEAVQELKPQYDFVIIDCPPSIGHLCFNALRASEEAIIPIDMSLFSLRGVAKLTDIITLLESSCGHAIAPRALVTMYDYRTRYSRHVLGKVQEKFVDKVFETVIRYNSRLRETVDHGLPVGDYDKHAIGQKDYEKLADEVMSSESVALTREGGVSSTADDIMAKTQEYIDSMEESPSPKGPSSGPEEIFPYPAESTYSAMIEAIKMAPSDSAEHEDNIGEFE
jgi:chromosome partitioning protein